MKLVSKNYSNVKLKVFDTVIEFKNGKAEVSDEVGKMLLEAKFEDIFEEGKEPKVLSKTEEDFDKDIKKLNEEYLHEIDGLKATIKHREEQIEELKVQVDMWKAEYNKLVENKKKEAIRAEEAPSTSKAEETNDEIDSLRKELQKMKVDELKTLATEEGIDIKDLRKDELIDAIIKNEQE